MRRVLIAMVLGGCATSPAPEAKEQTSSGSAAVHVGDEWFEHRAPRLGMTAAEAKARDETINDDGPPVTLFWDQQLATEVAGLWDLLCNECHGGKRDVAAAATIPAPPHGWGRQAGVFFGRERTHREVFQSIYYGSESESDDKPQEMPPWGEKVSKEQIWGLVYYLEFESGRKRAGLRRK